MNRSVSKLLSFPCKTAEILSSPIPVSMLGFGRGVRFPDSSLLYCIKTRFHSSRNLSQSHPTLHSELPHPASSPLSIIISEHGPQGPVSPICQKLSFAPRRTILSEGIPVKSFHSFSASSSFS